MNYIQNLANCDLELQLANKCSKFNACFKINHNLGVVSTIKFNSFTEAVGYEHKKYVPIYTAIVDNKLVVAFDAKGEVLIPNGHVTKQVKEDNTFVYRYILVSEEGILLRAITLSNDIVPIVKQSDGTTVKEKCNCSQLEGKENCRKCKAKSTFPSPLNGFKQY